MKIAVITRHAVPNYGSLLQTIATQEALNDLGHECEIIDYIRKDEYGFRQEITLLKNKPNWNKPLKKYVYLAIRQPGNMYIGKCFEKQRAKYLNLTCRYSSEEDLKSKEINADVFMTGSDQVWGYVGDGSDDSVYCLSFTNKRKISYGASIGKEEVSEEEKSFFKRYLPQYDEITVREESAVKILSELGISSTCVVDPVLLFDGEYWKKYTREVKQRKYVLIYQIGNDRELSRYANQIAKQRNAKLIRITPTMYQMFATGRCIWSSEVSEFLSYMKTADFLVTNSFHGTAFAINLNIPFVVSLPKNKTATRIENLLKIAGLEDRIVNETGSVEIEMEQIDFLNVNQRICAARKDSWETLKRIIEG